MTLQAGYTVQLNDFATLHAVNSITNNGGTLQLAGPLANVTGPMTNTAGYVRGTGRFTAGLNNGAAGTIRVETGDHIIIDTVGPTNLGTIELAGGASTVTFYDDVINNGDIRTVLGRDRKSVV